MIKENQAQDNKVYQLKISIKSIKPAIWREFIVPSTILLPDLHEVIQIVMGWTNSHLHQFIINGDFYSEPDEEAMMKYIDYTDIALRQVVSKEKETFVYEYDFGDGWEHTITVEKILPDSPLKHPLCLAGKRNCPPEDCGGPFGYMDLLRIISDPKNKEYKEMIEWLGSGFDPEYFDPDEINQMLKEPSL
ncbi:MAG: plasmid pRiA4b ORF-3 family protein [Spirochaetales bacterium]|nr:plasmid pRiA4b ORF-3 family protein [Spirochaetales bacterium]